MTIRAELDNMRERIEISDDVNDLAHVARTDLPRLLDAVEKVLAECAQMSTGSDTEAFCAERVRDAITTALEGKDA